MLHIKNLEQFTDRSQTTMMNVVREYCQHLFLSHLYKQPGSEKLLFKGGTALRIVFGSPRYSEDLDFTGTNITEREIEDIFTDTLASVEKTGIQVTLEEGQPTSGGYIGIMSFNAYEKTMPIQIEISLRKGRPVKGTVALIDNEYIPAYTLVHLSKESIVEGKMQALINRHKPRDFYDYFFLLSGNYPLVKEKKNLTIVQQLLDETKINFRSELREFLPASHSMHLRDFKKVLEQKISIFLG
ncbi:MAG: nucleotidyl transferase AbiEii/AbiGii toxin family protein [Candidatus Kerfeldbacteria bacterium]|nr:nucleotidyl transferase AbiEii/AbiGii toxin family protein [Candidatus Kerfeldbacteria bacterium]